MKLPLASLVCLLASPLLADEGLWLFNQFPKDQVKEKYGVDVTDAFLDHVRLSTVTLGAGSGAWVSPQGLIVTNRHLVAGCAAALGLNDAFYAATGAEERKCAGLEAKVLVHMEDVTLQVTGVAADTLKPAEALARRNTAIARLEQACAARTGNLCRIVKLHSGERYDLYQYKAYGDLRLVFVPEPGIAAFGGAPASLTYPRYSLDVAFLRAYENGRPAATPQYLKWSEDPIREGDLVFAAGSPLATSRLSTAAQLAFYRDTALPTTLARLETRIALLRGLKNSDAALASLAAQYKLAAGKLIGLRDDWLMARKTRFEKKLRNAVEADPKLGTEGGKVWDGVAAAYKAWTPFEKPYQVLESPAAEGSELFRVAREIVRLGAEGTKPNEQRLAPYRAGAVEALDQSLYTPAPIDDAIETALLARYLEDLKALGEKDAPLKTLLAGKTPQQAAEEWVRTTRLKDIAQRRRLAADNRAVLQSEDGILRLARTLEEPARKLIKRRADTIESLETSAAERIAQYRYKVFGAADYPDATATLRLTFGAAKAYRDRSQAPVPYATTLGGLYYLAAGGQEPYRPTARWIEAKPSLDLVVPLDFVSTCDIASGPSGSPVVNSKGELTGIAFDGNLDSIAATYLYSEDLARAVHVASQGVAQALQKLYHAAPLVTELGIRADAKVAMN